MNDTTGFIGIDPGVTGAIAFIYPSGSAAVCEPPIIQIPVGKRRRSQMLERQTARLIRAMISSADGAVWKAAIEWAQAMPILREKKGLTPCPTCGRSGDPEALARQGTVSAFSFGMNFGAWLGILGALEIPVEKFRPQHWKNVMLAGYGDKGKDAARVMAANLFPDVDLGKRKDQGRSEALLIAECLRRLHGGADA